MNPTEIDYGFRTIKLVFKGKADFTEYELELLRKYKQLHSDWIEISKEIDAFEKSVEAEEKRLQENILLNYDLDKLLTKITVGATFTPIESGVNVQVTEEFYEDFIPLVPMMNVLEVAVKENYKNIEETLVHYHKIQALVDAIGNDLEELDEFEEELYNNQEKYDIDLASWAEDVDAFRGPFCELCQDHWDTAKTRRNNLVTNKFNPFNKDYTITMAYVKGNATEPSDEDITKIKGKPSEIKFGFRTINLKYNNQGELSPYELELLGRYYHLHRDFQTILELIDDFEEKKDMLEAGETKARKMYKIRMNQWDELVAMEGKLKFRNDKKTVEAMNKLGRKYNDYFKQINEVMDANDNLGLLISDLINNIMKRVSDFKERQSVFARYANRLSDHDSYEIDVEIWKEEKENFRIHIEEELKEFEGLKERFEEVINTVHNPFIAEIEIFIAKVKKFNDEKLAKPDIDPKVKRIKNYELPADSEQMTKYSKDVNAAAMRGQGIQIAMAWTAVLRNDTSAILDIVRVSQHKKEWLHNLIYGINVTFPDLPNTEPMGSDKNIFKSPRILDFLAHMGEIPMLYFFLVSGGIGGYLLWADLVIDGTISVKYDDPESMWLKINSDHFPTIFGRLFDGCVHFQEFCYGTGIETKPHIDFAIKTIYDTFNMGEMFPRPTVFNYDAVVEAWKEKYHR